MKIINKLKSCMTALAICACTTTALATPYHQSAWNTGEYHNMFTYYGATLSDYDVRNRMQQQYDQLFKGDSANETLMYPDSTNSNRAFILDVNSDDIRSEGMSYGMMIAVQMNDQETFDRLWRFADTYMRNSNGTFAWQLNATSPYAPKNGTSSQNPAPDAEEYIAMALFFAKGRQNRFDWVDTGIDYEAEAQAVLNVIRTQLFYTANGYTQILFTPAASENYKFTDPSYHLPAFYEVWKSLDTANAAFWAEAHLQSRTLQFGGAHPTTGLFSEYSTFEPGPTPVSNLQGAMTAALATGAGVSEPQASDAPYFFSDAHRVIGNIGMDFAWFTSCCLPFPTSYEKSVASKLERDIVEKQYAFYSSRNDVDGGYQSGYTLDGTPKSGAEYRAPGHVAMNAVGSIAVDPPTPTARNFVHALWDQDVPTGQYRYYDGLLHMLGMLHVSGRFRIYAPLASGILYNQTYGSNNQSQIAYTLRNTDQAVQSNLTAYYYFTAENGRTPVVDDIYTPNISSLSLQNLGGNQWAVRMQYAGVTLDPAETVSQEDTFRVRYSDWSNFDIGNDFSAPESDQTESARIAVFDNTGKLIMGSKPQGVSDPTPGTYTIRVRARGTSGNEIVKLTVGGTVVATWNLSTAFKDYLVSTALGGGINVEYTNDAPNRDVIVDYAVIGGVTHQAEAQTGNSAAWGNGHCGGGQYTEWMHCNGYLGFSAYK